MKKFLLLVFCLSSYCISFAQSPLSTERIGEMLRMSKAVVFSKEISEEILAFSNSPAADRRQVEKNLIFLRTLLNEEIPASERKAFSDLVIRQFDREGSGQSVAIPLPLLMRIRTELQIH